MLTMTASPEGVRLSDILKNPDGARQEAHGMVHAAVSYTHLDVYKRQLFSTSTTALSPCTESGESPVSRTPSPSGAIAPATR